MCKLFEQFPLTVVNIIIIIDLFLLSSLCSVKTCDVAWGTSCRDVVPNWSQRLLQGNNNAPLLAHISVFFFSSIYLFYIYIVLLQDLKMKMLFVELNIRLQE